MPLLESSRASLRIVGDSLIPSKITQMLGSKPTDSQQKGDVITGRSTGRARIAKTGMWWLEAEVREPGDLCGQIEEILGKLTNDMHVWRDVGIHFQIELFCGLFMSSGNDGVSIQAKHLRSLAERGIEIALDIYDSSV